MLNGILRGIKRFVGVDYSNISSYVESYGEKQGSNYVIEYVKAGVFVRMELIHIKNDASEVYLKLVPVKDFENGSWTQVESKFYWNGIVHHIETKCNKNKEYKILSNYKTDNVDQIASAIKSAINGHILCDTVLKGRKSESTTWI